MVRPSLLMLVTVCGAGILGFSAGRRTAPVVEVEVDAVLEMERELLPYILADGSRGVDTCYTPANALLPLKWRQPDSTLLPDSSLMVPWDSKTGRPWDYGDGQAKAQGG